MKQDVQQARMAAHEGTDDLCCIDSSHFAMLLQMWSSIVLSFECGVMLACLLAELTTCHFSGLSQKTCKGVEEYTVFTSCMSQV